MQVDLRLGELAVPTLDVVGEVSADLGGALPDPWRYGAAAEPLDHGKHA